MNEKHIPTSAVMLNGWIEAHFQAFHGPARSWFELPFPVTIGFEEEQRSCTTQHRVSYITLGFKGPEEECCKAIAEWLYAQISYEEYCDAYTPLFIRRPFVYEKDESFGLVEYVTGRLAFWDNAKNRKLIASPAYKPEGAMIRSVKMPDDMFDRR